MTGLGKIHEVVATTFHILAIIFTLAALIPFVVLSYWALDTRPPLENVSVRFDHWHPEDKKTAILVWRADRNRICNGTGHLWLFGDRPYSLPSAQLPPPRAAADIGKKGVEWYEAVEIPPDALHTDNSHLYLNIRLIWQCNPLQTWSPLVLDLPEISIAVPGNPQ